jgi:PelA/Pel-15E family pectate lyase
MHCSFKGNTMRIGIWKYAVICLAAAPSCLAADAPSFVNKPDSWFATDQGKAVVANIISWEMPTGGWEKEYDATKPNTARIPHQDPNALTPEAAAATQREAGSWDVATLDNNATHSELRILARAVTLQHNDAAKDAFFKGLDAALAAQYPSGGWPQRFPPGNNYGRYITFNDGAMIGIMEVLQSIANGEPPYQFVDDDRRGKARSAVQKGIECILDCQIIRDGRPTVWCAQHDEKTLAPAPARAYELPSLSGGESADIVIFLMHLDHPDARIRRAVEGAAAWFDQAKILGKRVRFIRTPDGKRDRILVDDPAAPPMWARFYDLDTNQPFFCGRNGVKKPNLADIEQERRGGYNWYGYWGAKVAAEYAEWKRRNPDAGALTAPLPAAR